MASPGLLEQVRERLIQLCQERGVDRKGSVTVRVLSPEKAIGDRAAADFPIKKGKERVIEATFGEGRGQAFTDQPSDWAGSLGEALALDLTHVRKRAVFVAALNAVARSIDLTSGTLHCRDEDPTRCGPEIANILENRYGNARIGLIGLQPAILRALTARFGSDSVRVVDLNPDNIGETKLGVLVWDGATELPRLVDWCEVGLSTGSSLVNGSIDEIKRLFEEADKPLVFYGNTISGVAALLGLDHICPFGR